MSAGEIKSRLVAHKDRLCRFEFDFFEYMATPWKNLQPKIKNGLIRIPDKFRQKLKHNNKGQLGQTLLENDPMKKYTAIIERCSETKLYVGYIPGFPGAHSQADTIDELHKNLKEVIEMLLEDGPPKIESEFIGTQLVEVAC